jgi:hypothetical protein
MRKLRASTTVALFSILFSTLTIPNASAITAGSCNVTVSSATGVVLVNNGGYCYLAFSNTGANSFTVPSGVTSSSVLVIGGGGAGGSGAWGGGGGAGGVLYGSSYPLTPGATMNLSVGAGGLTGTANLDPATNRSNNGEDSWINSSSTFVAKGGGAGASFAWGDTNASNRNGSNGGSGGGGTENAAGGAGGTSTQTLPTYATTSYANAGGSTAATNNVSGGGGGGSGGVGVNSVSSGVAGAGGAGINVFSAWFTALGQFSVSGYIAGGGGGGSNGTRGSGGSGGGGSGGDPNNTTAGNGVASTGSGGGGATYNGSALPGGNGGSGLIIFRFTAVVNPAVINTPTTSGAIYKGVTTTISVTMDSPGVVQFFTNNKRIGKCVSVATTGSSPNYLASCSWKPTTSGTHLIKAQLTPSNIAQSAQTSAARSVQVLRRTTIR